jgi:hypothetical protein
MKIDVLGGVLVLTFSGRVVAGFGGVVWRVVAEGSEEPRDAVPAVRVRFAGGRHPVAGLHQARDALVVVGGVLGGCGDGPVAEFLAAGAWKPQRGVIEGRDEVDELAE